MALQLVVDSVDSLDEGVKALYVAKEGKFHLDVTGVEDTKGLKSALEAERKANRDVKDAIKQFDGIDPVKYRSVMDMFDKNEDAKLLMEGKTDEVFARRNAKFQEESDKRVKAAEDKAAAAVTRASRRDAQYMQSLVQAAALEAGINPNAAVMRDVFLNIKENFVLDEADNIVQLDADGKPILGKDGKTPYGLGEFFVTDGSKESRPHWYLNGNSGSSQNNSGKGNGAGKVVKQSTIDSMAPKARAAFFAANPDVSIID